MMQHLQQEQQFLLMAEFQFNQLKEEKHEVIKSRTKRK